MAYTQHILIESTMDHSIHKHLPSIMQMAHDRSELGRIALAEKVSEVFLAPSAALSRKEEILVSKLILDLIQHENPAVRQALVDQFTKAMNAPREVALRVAHGPIELAGAVLATNENLFDADLIDIISEQTDEHAAAIATRRTINEAVADALVATGSLQVMRIVAENLGAKLSPHAMDLLVESARLAAVLHQPIMTRPEINSDQAMKLFWWVEQDLRRATLEKFGYGPNKLESALDKAVDEALSAHIFECANDDAMQALADWLEERNALIVRYFLPMLRMGHYRLFNIALSRLNGLDLQHIDTIMSTAGSRMMVVLCRALNIDKGTFISIFLMSRGGRKDEQVVNPRELSLMVEAFERIKPNMAQSMMESWKADPSDIYRRTEVSEASCA